MRAFRDPLLIIIIVLSLVVSSSTLTRGHDWGDDFASYIMQAKSILNGGTQEFVEHNRFTISESSIQIGPIAYPWGFPLILTPFYALKGNSPLALKLPSLFFFGGFLVCLFVLTKNRFTRTESLLLVSVFAFNPMLVKFLNQILSDIPFLFFSTLALLLMVNGEKHKAHDDVMLGVTISFAFFIRTTGILLLASFLVLEFFKGWTNRTDHELVRKNLWNAFIVCGSFGVLWIIYALLFPGGGESYFAQYQGFRLENAPDHINAYFHVFSLFFGETTIWRNVYYILFVFFLIGLWMRRKEETIFIIFSLLWMILLVTWPAWQGPRFIFPLLPIFIYFTFQGMKTILQKLSEGRQVSGQRVFIGFWLLIIGIFLFNSSINAYNILSKDRATTGPFDEYSTEVYEFIKRNTPPDSIVVFFKPRAMRLFTDRDAFMSFECKRLPLGDYVVISKKAENSQVPVDQIGSCNLPLDDVYENRRFIVYKILK